MLTANLPIWWGRQSVILSPPGWWFCSKRGITDAARNLTCSLVFPHSHQKTVFFSLACAVYRGVLGMLQSAIGMLQRDLCVRWGKLLVGDVFKCSDFAQAEDWWQSWSAFKTQCGHAVGDVTNLHDVRFIAFSCLFSSGLGAVLPEMQRCLAKPGRGEKEVREESRRERRLEERNASLKTDLKAQAVFEA